jgi:hypothetical protein
MALFLILTSIISAQSKSATLDQYQLDGAGGAAYHSGDLIAQTFTAGFNQTLDRIDVYMSSASIAAPTFPTTVTLRETDFGKPNGTNLASFYYANGFGGVGHAGWFSIDFSQQNISLTQGQTYALVFTDNDATIPYTNWLGVSWNPTSYLGGELWENYDIKGWVVVSAFGGGDLAFQTYGTPTVPVPATAWLFGSALLGFAGTARKRR